jgi:hypothetical protein
MRTKLALLLAIGLLVAVSAQASYTVYLKDGSTLQARQPYSVEGETAIIVLENGTRAALPLAEIDVERTQRSNEGGLAGAKVLRDGRFVDVEEVESEVPRRETLGTMISAGRATATSAAPEQPSGAAGAIEPAGSEGEESVRGPYADEALTQAIQEAFVELQIEKVEVLQGTAGAPLLEVIADSESAVFRGLRVAARVLAAVRAARPGQIPAFDLHFLTAEGQEGGSFRMSPEQAEELDERRVEPSEFYVRYVRF